MIELKAYVIAAEILYLYSCGKRTDAVKKYKAELMPMYNSNNYVLSTINQITDEMMLGFQDLEIRRTCYNIEIRYDARHRINQTNVSPELEEKANLLAKDILYMAMCNKKDESIKKYKAELMPLFNQDNYVLSQIHLITDEMQQVHQNSEIITACYRIEGRYKFKHKLESPGVKRQESPVTKQKIRLRKKYYSKTTVNTWLNIEY